MDRPAIPADIKRAVLVEAGHRCAIPRCGQTELDIHHIIPWERCKKHEYSNLIALCPVCHRRAHNGEIDRKSLFQYKNSLASGFGNNGTNNFLAPIVEMRRRIFEKDKSAPGYLFRFDFPDFQNPVERIVSKNIEAWGYELLAKFRDNQENFKKVKYDDDVPPIFTTPSTLYGDYHIVRHDNKIISVKYILDRYITGAGHSGRTTRVQNFIIKPFQPITLTDLIGDEENLTFFAKYIRQRLAETGDYDHGWLLRGTEPKEQNFNRFNVERRGISFTFSEYQIDCYAAGEQHLWLSFNELAKICDKTFIEKIK